MAITVLSTPPALGLVKNPLPFKLKSDNVVVEEPSSSYTDFYISAGATVAAGDTIRFQWGENDITFQGRDNLLQDGLEFPTGTMNASLSQAIADNLLDNFTISESFTIAVTFDAGLNRYQFRVTFISPGEFSLTINRTIADDGGTIVFSTTHTGDPGETRPDFQYFYELYASNPTGTFERIYSGRQAPGQDNEAVIDISGSLQAVMLNVDFPRHDSAAITRCTESRRKYYIRYGEYYDGQVRSTYKSAVFVALSGGYDLQNYPGSDFLAYLTASGGRQYNRFLSYDNDPVIARVDQPEFLSFINLHADITMLQVRVTIRFTDGSSVISTLLSKEVEQYDKLHIPAGYSQLQLGTIDAEKQVKEWDIVLLNQSGEVSSETRTYLLKTKPELATRYFLYSTSLGGIKTLRTAGVGSQELEVFKSKATKVLPYDYKAEDGSSLDYNQAFEEGEAVATGFLIRRQVTGLTDLFRSRHKFRIAGGKQLPVIINTNSIKLGADRQNQYAVKFEYRFLFENTEFTDPYINLPASENSDIRVLLDPQPALPDQSPGGDQYDYWVLKAGLTEGDAPDPGTNVYRHQEISLKVDPENPFMILQRTVREVVFKISKTWFDTRYLTTEYNFDGRYYTKTESDERFAPFNHNHDGRYFTKQQVRDLIAAHKTVLEVSGPITVDWSGLVPSGGQTFAQKHGNHIQVQGFRDVASDPAKPDLIRRVSYAITALPSWDDDGDLIQVEFADIYPGIIVIT